MKILRQFKPIIVGIMCASIVTLYCNNNSYAKNKNNTINGVLNVITPPEVAKKSIIKIALLLDTSSSMNGLIEQAKSQFWNIVNALAHAKKDNTFAKVEIALYQYGNSSLDANNGYIQKVLPLTNDLDELSEKLFSLTTNGGNEFCGEVIQLATEQLNWQQETNDLNLIFIAGNEPFTQGNIDYKMACKKALNKGITINAIYCGDYDDGINSFWQQGAYLTEGKYMTIDMNKKTIYVETPYDKEIASLNTELNKTYIAYGRYGTAKLANQTQQDLNSITYGRENMVNRAVSKSNHLYLNSKWDLVDASSENNFDINNINENDLPSEMKNMTLEQKKIYINTKKQDRRAIQDKINNLNSKRLAYLKNKENNNSASLNNVIVNSIKQQAMTKGFTFDDVVTNKKNENYPLANVDFDYFETLTAEAKIHRATRLLDFNTFINYSNQPNTIILDTRSKRMYDKLHIKGAIHINFSDFTQDYLNEMIPDKNTRILIYCNNNFKQDQPLINLNFATKAVYPIELVTTNKNIDSKKPHTLALNIPTYINLYGYGYKNVYELHELVNSNSLGLKLEGTDADKLIKQF